MFWTWLVRTLCWHEYVRRWEKGRLFVMCLKCGHESKGIQTGGFKYGSNSR